MAFPPSLRHASPQAPEMCTKMLDHILHLPSRGYGHDLLHLSGQTRSPGVTFAPSVLVCQPVPPLVFHHQAALLSLQFP